MVALFILMLERGGLIILLAYLLMNIPYFRDLLGKRHLFSTKLQLVVIFGLFAIISNYTGVEISRDRTIVNQLFTTLSPGSSLANTRVLTIGMSGLIGGPFVGTIVGIISAIIRYLQGGKTISYIISSLLIGVFSGIYGRKLVKKNTFPSIKEGMLIGIVMEGIQMLCILIFGNEIRESLSLVSFIGLPMILTNSIGTAIFLSIILSTLQKEEQTKAVQTHDVLQLANETLPYFRLGLNEESCTAAASIIQRVMKVSAVSITNQERILAHVGAASDHHIPSNEILTHLSKEVLRTGQIKEAHSKQEIGCNHADCPLSAAVVIPLKVRQQTIGTLKFYFTDSNKLTFVEQQLAEGLGIIFSNQIELGEMELQSKLLQDAEIKSLQAQVNPHFFFNAMNTISALIRIDSEKARKLLNQLSSFFRSNLQGARTNLISLTKELQQVEAYLELEQARFPNRYTVTIDYDPALREVLVPPFLIQILVENALKHAFTQRKTGNEVQVKLTQEAEGIRVCVEDNGQGIEADKLSRIGKEVVESEKGTGSALENLNKRLVSLLGEKARLKFQSSKEGTVVSCLLPFKEGE